MQSIYRDHLHLTGLPAPLLQQVRSSPGLAVHLGGPVAQQAGAAFSDGMQTALLWAAALAVAAAVAVAALLRRATR